jgi:hypothetical protein
VVPHVEHSKTSKSQAYLCDVMDSIRRVQMLLHNEQRQALAVRHSCEVSRMNSMLAALICLLGLKIGEANCHISRCV